MIVLLPGSSSISPESVAAAPDPIDSVRPLNLVRSTLPLAARPATPASCTVPSPVHTPPLQLFTAPVSVSVPLPPSTPPLCVYCAAVTAPLAVKLPPLMLITFADSGPPAVSDPLLTPSVLLITETPLPSTSDPPLTCTCSLLEITAAACEPLPTVMVCTPARSGINTAWPAVGTPRLQFDPSVHKPPVALIQVFTASAAVTFMVTLPGL